MQWYVSRTYFIYTIVWKNYYQRIDINGFGTSYRNISQFWTTLFIITKIIEGKQNRVFTNKTLTRDHITKNCFRNKYLKNSCKTNKIDYNRLSNSFMKNKDSSRKLDGKDDAENKQFLGTVIIWKIKGSPKCFCN